MAKSLYVRFCEVVDLMTARQRDKFYALRKTGDPIEVQLNCAEAVLTGKKVREAEPNIRKNNGREMFTESVELMTEAATQRAKSDKIMREALGIPEPAKMPEGLTAVQLAEYKFARGIGLSESAALAMAKMPHRIR